MNITHPVVKKAFINLMFTQPFFSSILLQQQIVETEDVDTFAVDGTHLFINKKFASTLTYDEIQGVLLHEAAHVFLLHIVRKGNRDHNRFNRAADYVVNLIVIDSGFKLPKDVLLDQRYKGMSTEEVYRLLEEEDSKNGNKNNDKGCGIGEVIQAKDLKKVEEDTKVLIESAIATARRQGKLPEFIKRQIEEATKSRYDWKELLNQFLTEVCKKDYSWKHPNRRYIDSGFIMPSRRGLTYGKFILAIDTSGSIGLRECSLMVKEVLSVLELLLEDKEDVELTVIYCDTHIQNVEVLTDSNDKPVPRGGGGTCYRAPFQYVIDNNLECAAFLYLTDGYCDSYPNPKDVNFPVYWGLIQDNPSFNPPFGGTFKFDAYSQVSN